MDLLQGQHETTKAGIGRSRFCQAVRHLLRSSESLRPTPYALRPTRAVRRQRGGSTRRFDRLTKYRSHPARSSDSYCDRIRHRTGASNEISGPHSGPWLLRFVDCGDETYSILPPSDRLHG